MKLSWMLSRANELIKYPETLRKKRLRIQWAEMIGLPFEAVPHNKKGG